MSEPSPANRVVVVGGGLAGGRSAESLRRHGHTGEIVLLCEEPHLPYDRPPLSKAVLGGERDNTDLGIDVDVLKLDVRRGTRATGLDLATRTLSTASSGEIGFDKLIIATGADPILLPGSGEQFTLRTIDDALTLRTKLTPGARVVIVGASWIGAETATAAVKAGCTVTCVEFDPGPSARAIGPVLSQRLIQWWDGVNLRLNTAVAEIADSAVILSDGTSIDADVVVTGVGVRPGTTWLEGSGLEIDRGIVVDEWLRASADVAAVGDVTAWWSRRFDKRIRVGHWDNAVSGASIAAATVLREASADGEALFYDTIPYFWSDQFGHKIQYLGHHDNDCSITVREPSDGKGWSAAWVDATGQLVAVLTVDRPRDLAAARKALANPHYPDLHRLADPDVTFADA